MKAPEFNSVQQKFLNENKKKISRMNKIELEMFQEKLYDSKQLMLDSIFKKLQEAIDERIIELNSYHEPESFGGATAVYATIEYED